MDLQLNLTDVPPDRVSKILAFVSREIGRRNRPRVSGRTGVLVKWAEKRGTPFTYADVVRAFPDATEVNIRGYISTAFKDGSIVRVGHGEYRAANSG